MQHTILSIDWLNFFIGEEKWEFLMEIVLRTFLMFIIILFGLRLLGKRGIKQLSIFELVVIISLGSAAGDPMFYKEVGILIPVVIFAVIVLCYRLTTYLSAKNEKIDDLVEGTCTYLIENGEFSIGNFNKEVLPHDEFFSELRQASITHLGQVQIAIMETSGSLSIYFYPDEEVRYGLPILPNMFQCATNEVVNSGIYACAFCGNVEELEKSQQCPKCKKDKWVAAINSKRIK